MGQCTVLGGRMVSPMMMTIASIMATQTTRTPVPWTPRSGISSDYRLLHGRRQSHTRSDVVYMGSDLSRQGVLVAADSNASVFTFFVLMELSLEEALELVCGGIKRNIVLVGGLLGVLDARRSEPFLDEVDGFR